MADTLIVYYSLEGNVDSVAKMLAEELGADLCRLETVKEYPKKGLLKFFHGGKDVVTGFKPELKTALPDLGGYKKIVVGCPVWAGKPAAPINTFFDGCDLSGKSVALFTSSAGGNGEKTLDSMASSAEKKGGNVVARESYVSPSRNPDAAREVTKAFAKRIG